METNEKSRVLDMTRGNPFRLVLKFALPLFFGNLLQQFYNLADTAIAGHVLGDHALAQIGAVSALYGLITNFAFGMNNGLALSLSRSFGAGDEQKMKHVSCWMVTISMSVSIVLMSIFLLCKEPLLILLQVPEETMAGAMEYLTIILIGIPFTMAYNMEAAMLQAVGNSMTPLLFLLFSSVLNISLDYAFMAPLAMGIGGAAFATVLSQGVSAFLAFILIWRNYPLLHFKGKDYQVEKKFVLEMVVAGFSMALMSAIYNIGSVILQSAVNTLGSNAVASMTAGSKIGMFFCCPFDAMGSTMATYGGQNVGAKKMDRISKGLKACSMLGIGYAILAFVILALTGRNLALFFVERAEVEVIGNVYLFLLINSAFYIPLAFVNIVRFLIQGMGYSKFAILAGVCEMAARTLVGFALVPLFGFPAACFASPVAWIFADAFLFPAYRHVYRKTEKMLNVSIQ